MVHPEFGASLERSSETLVKRQISYLNGDIVTVPRDLDIVHIGILLLCSRLSSPVSLPKVTRKAPSRPSYHNKRIEFCYLPTTNIVECDNFFVIIIVREDIGNIFLLPLLFFECLSIDSLAAILF